MFAARASLALLSRAAFRHRRSGLRLFAAAAVLAHLLTAAAIVFLPRMAGLLHHGAPPPNGQAMVELVMENTPTVGGSRLSNPARPNQPTRVARTDKPAPSPLGSRNAPDQVSASSAQAAARTAPQAAEPTPATRQASVAPKVNLDEPGEPGYGLVSGANVIPASPDSAHLNQPPDYPITAGERGEQGSVYLVVTVAPDGHPTAVEIAASSGYRLLDEEAVRAVWRWHFRPEIRDGHPVQSFFNQSFDFIDHP